MSDDLTRSFNGSVDEKLNQIISLIQSLDSRVTGVELAVQGIGSRLSAVESSVQSIDSRLSSLEEKVDTRLRETQPIWERVLSEIGELRARQDQFQKGLDELSKDTRLGLRKVERQIMQLSKDSLEHRTNLVMLEDRIEKLEGDNV
jgi:predicted  nucleic acid-binding Zn-ribbon protein